MSTRNTHRTAALHLGVSWLGSASALWGLGVIYRRGDADILFRKSRNIRRSARKGCRSLLSSAAVSLALLTTIGAGIAIPERARASEDIQVNVDSDISLEGDAVYVSAPGDEDITVTTQPGTTLTSVIGDGIDIRARGGDIAITSNSAISADPGIYAYATGYGDVTIYSFGNITATDDGIAAYTVDGDIFIEQAAPHSIAADSDNNGSGDAIHAGVKGSGSIAIHVAAGATLYGSAQQGIYARTNGIGDGGSDGINDGNILIDHDGAIG